MLAFTRQRPQVRERLLYVVKAVRGRLPAAAVACGPARKLLRRKACPLLSHRISKCVQPVPRVTRNLLEASLSSVKLPCDRFNEVPVLDGSITAGTHSFASPGVKPLSKDTNDIGAVCLNDKHLRLVDGSKQL